MNSIEFNKCLYDYMQTHKVNKSVVAKRLGVTQTTLYNWSSGKVTPTGVNEKRINALFAPKPDVYPTEKPKPEEADDEIAGLLRQLLFVNTKILEELKKQNERAERIVKAVNG